MVFHQFTKLGPVAYSLLSGGKNATWGAPAGLPQASGPEPTAVSPVPLVSREGPTLAGPGRLPPAGASAAGAQGSRAQPPGADTLWGPRPFPRSGGPAGGLLVQSPPGALGSHPGSWEPTTRPGPPRGLTA